MKKDEFEEEIMLTSKQRAYLRSLANGIDAIFQVGKNGVTPELRDTVHNALEAREPVRTLYRSSAINLYCTVLPRQNLSSNCLL